MKTVIKLAVILVVVTAAILLTLTVAGVVSASDFWSDMSKVIQVVGIGLAASILVLFVGKS